MRISFAHSICTLILIDIFSVAATPVPLKSSGLIPQISSETQIGSMDNVNLSFAVVDNSIVARSNTDGDDEPCTSDTSKPEAAQSRPDPITIPPEFLPLGSSTIKMIIPTRLNLSGWGSVVNIANLIDAAANLDKDGQLHASRVAFRQQLETIILQVKLFQWKSLHALRQGLKDTRPTALVPENTTNVPLESLQDSIKKAMELHNMFEGELMIPQGFLGGAPKLAIKVPYGNGGKEAIASIDNILTLMRFATHHDHALQRQFKNFRQALTHNRFKLALPSSWDRKPILNGDQLCVILAYIQKMVKQHNAGQWMEKEDITKWEQGTSENTSCDFNISRERIVKIPRYFLPAGTQRVSMPVPLSNDTNGTDRVNGILMLMAKLDGTDTLIESWRTLRNRLVVEFKLNVIPEPEIWGTGGATETQEDQKQAIVIAVQNHRDLQRSYNRKRKRLAKEGLEEGGLQGADVSRVKQQRPKAAPPQWKRKNESHTSKVAAGLLTSSSSAQNAEPLHPQHEDAQGPSTSELTHQASGAPVIGRPFYDPVRDT